MLENSKSWYDQIKECLDRIEKKEDKDYLQIVIYNHMIICIYSELEKEVNDLLSSKLEVDNDFVSNYIKSEHEYSFHRGLQIKDLNDLLKKCKILEKTKSIEDFGVEARNIGVYGNFVKYRHDISHNRIVYDRTSELKMEDILKAVEQVLSVFKQLLR